MSREGEGFDSSTIIDRYLQLWQCDTEPDLDVYLQQSQQMSVVTLAEILRIDMRQRWHSQQRQLAEHYLEKFPKLLENVDATLDLIYTEYLLRENDDPHFDVDQFIARFPSYSSTLRAQIEIHHLTSSVDAYDTDRHLADESLADTTHPETFATQQSAIQGEVVGKRYRLISVLGQGGMGIVWKANDIHTGRTVALKMLKQAFSWSQAASERLLLEGRLAASISHPNCAYIFEVGVHKSEPFLVMELLSGQTLRDLIPHDPSVTYSQIVDLMLDVIDGVQAAHRAGVLHRDIKPSNCFVEASGRVKIGDFGLSQLLAELSEQGGDFSGTIAYAAPEQVLGKKVSDKTDQYGIGATLYHLLTGRPPFLGNMKEVREQVIRTAPQAIQELDPTLPIGLAEVVARTLAKEPSQRFRSLKSLRNALLPFSPSQSTVATTGKRMVAYGVDQLAIQALVTLLILVPTFVLVCMSELSSLENTKLASMKILGNGLFVGAIVNAIFTLGYYAYFEGRHGAGLGKRLMGLRVTDAQHSTPGWKKACLRAAILPGSFGLIFFDPLIIAYQNSITQASESDQLQRPFFEPLGYGQLQNIILLITLSTIRTRNGFRGLHELLTGTRTIALTKRREVHTPVPDVQSITVADTERRWGPYRAIRLIADTPSTKVWEAYDELLKRSTWVVEKTAPRISGTNTLHPSRPTRLRWIQTGVGSKSTWDAYEAVAGVTASSRTLQTSAKTWDLGRRILADLVSELHASALTDVLPETLSPSQWLVQADGRLVFIDFGLTLEREHAETTVEFSSPARSLELVRWFLSAMSDSRIWPPAYLEFKQLLEQQFKDDFNAIESLRQLNEYLQSCITQKTSVGWDDRCSLTCAAFFIDGWIYLVVIASTCMATSRLAANYYFLGASAVCAFAVLLPLTQILLLRKSLMFSILGVSLSHIHNREVKLRQRMLRECIAWTPWTINCALVFWIGSFSVNHQGTVDWNIIISMCLELLVLFLASIFWATNLALLAKTPERCLQERASQTFLYLR